MHIKIRLNKEQKKRFDEITKNAVSKEEFLMFVTLTESYEVIRKMNSIDKIKPGKKKKLGKKEKLMKLDEVVIRASDKGIELLKKNLKSDSLTHISQSVIEANVDIKQQDFYVYRDTYKRIKEEAKKLDISTKLFILLTMNEYTKKARMKKNTRNSNTAKFRFKGVAYRNTRKLIDECGAEYLEGAFEYYLSRKENLDFYNKIISKEERMEIIERKKREAELEEKKSKEKLREISMEPDCPF